MRPVKGENAEAKRIHCNQRIDLIWSSTDALSQATFCF